MEKAIPIARISAQPSPKVVKLKAPSSSITLAGASYGCGNGLSSFKYSNDDWG